MKKTKIGLLGFGHWGKNIARNLHNSNIIFKIYDKNISNSEKNKFQSMIFCKGIEEILFDNSVDSVIIATPSYTHKELAISSLRKNKNVFIEKPFCLSLNDGKEIIKEAKKSEKLIFVGHLLNYHNGFLKLKEKIKSNLIGDILVIKSSRQHFGSIRKKESVIYDLAAHDISMILSITQCLPKEVQVNSVFLNSKINPDIANITLSFKNNINAIINCDWISPYKEHRLSVLGTKGSLVFDDTKDWSKKLFFNPSFIDSNLKVYSKESKFIKLKEEQPLKKELESFIDCVKNNKQPITNYQEAINVQKVMSMIDNKIYDIKK